MKMVKTALKTTKESLEIEDDDTGWLGVLSDGVAFEQT